MSWHRKINQPSFCWPFRRLFVSKTNQQLLFFLIQWHGMPRRPINRALKFSFCNLATLELEQSFEWRMEKSPSIRSTQQKRKLTIRNELRFIRLNIEFSIWETLRKILRSSRSFSNVVNKREAEAWKEKKSINYYVVDKKLASHHRVPQLLVLIASYQEAARTCFWGKRKNFFGFLGYFPDVL